MWCKMLLNDGVVNFYNLENVAEFGNMPSEQLVFQFSQYFGNRTISFSRQYLAKGVNEQIDSLIRVWDEGNLIRIGMFATIESAQFRVDNVTFAYDDDTQLKVFDITLQRLESLYDIK